MKKKFQISNRWKMSVYILPVTFAFVIFNVFFMCFTCFKVGLLALSDGVIPDAFIKGRLIAFACVNLTSFVYLTLAIHHSGKRIERISIRSENMGEQLHKLSHLTYRDGMTGARNRYGYFDDMRKLCERAEKNVGIVFCDINGLKTANDNYGHEAGDALINEAVVLLTAKFNKPTDTLYRIGGDEFVVCRRNISQEDFYEEVQLFIEALEDNPVMSIGEVWIDECRDIEEQIKVADAEMYRRKTEYYRKSGIERRK